MKKKIIVVLLVLVLLFLSACGKAQKTDAIKPVQKDAVKVFIQAFEGMIDLRRVDTEVYANAEEILRLAYECLDQNGIKANITDIYEIPLGFASTWFSVESYVIYHDKDTTNQIVMMVLRDELGRDLIGSYKMSDVDQGDFHGKTNEEFSKYEKEILKKLGFDDSKYSLYFPATEVRKVELKNEVSDDVKKLYENAVVCFDKVEYRMWKFGDKFSDMYQIIDEPDVKSLGDLKKFIGKSFDEFNTQQIYNLVTVTDDYYTPYKEINGGLYTIPTGMGANFELKGITPKMSGVYDDVIYLILDAEYNAFNEDYTKVLYSYNQEYLFKFKKEGDTYKCSKFVDIARGRYETIY